MKIKTGILGCGMIGLSFIKQSLEHENFEVVSLCSKSVVSLEKASQLVPKAKQYLNKEEFFRDREIDAVIVCTPHSHHAEDVILSLDFGKHVLVEKPISTNKMELIKVINKSYLLPKQVVTALPHGNYEFIRTTQDIINLGTIGKVTSLHSYLDVPGPPRSNWYYSKSAVGGATLDTLPYALGRLLMLLKTNVSMALGLKNQLIHRRVCGDGVTINPEVDDNATLLLLLLEGQQAIVRTNWNVSSAEDFLIVEGRQGKICIDVWRNTVTLRSRYEPDIIGMVKIEDNLYKREIPIVHPEYLKLQVFFEHINQGKGNLEEVAYFMEIIFSLLLKDGDISLPSPFYQKGQGLKNLEATNDYI